jgi:four helix bundle protein
VKADNVVRSKSYAFAVRIVEVCRIVRGREKGVVLVGQVLRSGTSVGANVEEAIGAQSRADFLSKMSIAYKEARETRYWVRLLHDTGYLDASEFEELYGAADELCRIIGSIIKATKENGGREVPHAKISNS